MSRARFHAVVPAAGVGRRMEADRPKQYLEIGGRALIAYTLERLCNHPAIDSVAVAVAEDDPWWDSLELRAARAPLPVMGGAERCHSVLNALARLGREADESHWVLVHDAVRPCLREADVTRLMERAGAHPIGGLLGVPVRDTMKRTDDDGEITATVERTGLWHAHTPQMFRLGPLAAALEGAVADGELVTDEAQAMERCGARALMVEGSPDNIKVTRRSDLALAELYLRAQGVLR